MIAQSRAESTGDIYNYGKYINQFPSNTIKAIRKYETIQKKICRRKMSIMFNEICINEEMLPIYIYIYIYICVCVCVCVCGCILGFFWMWINGQRRELSAASLTGVRVSGGTPLSILARRPRSELCLREHVRPEKKDVERCSVRRETSE